MYPTGDDERIQKRFHSLRDEERSAAPSFERVLAGASRRRAVARRTLTPWLAAACLALVAGLALIAIANEGSGGPAPAPTPSATGTVPVTAPLEPAETLPTNTASEKVGPVEPETVPAVAETPNRKNARPDRPSRRQRPAPPDTCADC